MAILIFCRFYSCQDLAYWLDLMEIIEDGPIELSSIIASQLPNANWCNAIGEDIITDVVLDRILQTSYGNELNGGVQKNDNIVRLLIKFIR